MIHIPILGDLIPGLDQGLSLLTSLFSPPTDNSGDGDDITSNPDGDDDDSF